MKKNITLDLTDIDIRVLSEILETYEIEHPETCLTGQVAGDLTYAKLIHYVLEKLENS